MQELPNVQIDARARLQARVVAALVAVLFAGQLVYVTIAEEPYPALMMPRFSWAGPNQASLVDIPVPEISLIYRDGKKVRLSQRELLGEFPTGHHSSIMGSILAPLPSAPPKQRAPAGKFEPPTWLFPGYGLARFDRTDPEHVASLKSWLRARSREIHAAAPVQSCVVDWYDDTYPYQTGSGQEMSRQGHTLMGTFEVDLHADSTPLP